MESLYEIILRNMNRFVLFRDNSPRIRTYGSKAAKGYSPDTWENINMNKVKLGRNDICKCGSGLKFKKCCGKAQ